MTQIIVTLNEDATTLQVRKVIELLRGVASVKVFSAQLLCLQNEKLPLSAEHALEMVSFC